jgi:NADPH:quinone reductase-like Zn-dependent oxidoreductase
MKAIIHERFGEDAVEFRDTAMPEAGDDQVLVRVRAASVNPIEFYDVYAPPMIRVLGGQLRRPKDPRLGADFAGTVEVVGKDVTGLAVGDDVFGTAAGSWAEHAVATATRVAKKPPSVSFEDAAALPIAALTALQAIRDAGGVQAGQKVLVNGASGGVGTYTVQLAKAWGADVTAVCSTGNVDLAKSLGADRVIDYKTDDFTLSSVRHDVMIDIAGSRSLLRSRRVLAPGAVVVLIGAKMGTSFLGPLKHLAASKLESLVSSQKAKFMMAKVESDDLALLGELMEAGRLRSIIDRRFALADAVQALRYLAEGHAKGKIVIDT